MGHVRHVKLCFPDCCNIHRSQAVCWFHFLSNPKIISIPGPRKPLQETHLFGRIYSIKKFFVSCPDYRKAKGFCSLHSPGCLWFRQGSVASSVILMSPVANTGRNPNIDFCDIVNQWTGQQEGHWWVVVEVLIFFFPFSLAPCTAAF